MSHSCIALFCEDIREEVRGTHSLVGILPDNVNFTQPATPPITAGVQPGSMPNFMLPKLGVYARINLDRNEPPATQVSLRLSLPGADDVSLGAADTDVIKNAYETSEGNGRSFASLIVKAVLAPVVFKQSGILSVYASIDDLEFACGALNVIIPSIKAS